MTLTRAQFMTVTNLGVDDFTQIRRRGVLPLFTSEGRNRYTVSDALLTRFMLGLSREIAALPYQRAYNIVELIADDVTELSHDLPFTEDPAAEIYAGGIYRQHPDGLTGFIGTANALADHLTTHNAARPVAVEVLSLTLTAQTMRATAQVNDIDLGNF